MREAIKKAFLLGLGVASLTKTEAEKRIKVLVKKSPLSAKDGKEMIKKILSGADKERKRISSFSKSEAKRALANLKKSAKPKVSKLKKKASILGKRLNKEGKKVARKALKKAYKRI